MCAADCLESVGCRAEVQLLNCLPAPPRPAHWLPLQVDEIRKAIPPGIDILLVEQEVQASEEITALQMVVNADTKRTALLKESKGVAPAPPPPL